MNKDHEWLYVRLYPGTASKMDLAISTIVAPAVQVGNRISGIDRWFYIRYVDHWGPHVRLRFRGRPTSITTLYGELRSLIDEKLHEVAAHPAPQVIRRIVPTYGIASDTGVAAYIDFYEPELDKYGGRIGVDVAEKLFQVSSEVSLEFIEYPISTMVAVAILLMTLTVKTMLPDRPLNEFWDHYAWYWTRQYNKHATDFRRSLYAAASRRVGLTQSCCREILSSDWFLRRLQKYQTAVLVAKQELEAHSVPTPIETQCLNYVHMMNNRLGFTPEEEVYLALLSSLSKVDLMPPIQRLSTDGDKCWALST